MRGVKSTAASRVWRSNREVEFSSPPWKAALDNAKREAVRASSAARILAFDSQKERVIAEYVYRFEPAEAHGPGATAHAIKIGGLVALSATRLLVLEHTDRQAKIFVIDIGRRDALSAALSEAHGDASLEAIADLASAGARPLAKRLIADLGALPEIPHKLEGLAMIDAHTLAVINDNDFGFHGFDARGAAVAQDKPTQIVTLRLPGTESLDRTGR